MHVKTCSSLVAKIFILLSIFQVVLCYDVEREDGNGNNLVDEIIRKTLEDFENKIEPCPLPDFQFTFNKKVFFLNYKGGVQFYDGMLYGLSSLRRGGDCDVLLSEQSFRLKANIAMDNLQWQYSGRISFLNMGTNFDLFGSIGHISAILELEAYGENKFRAKEVKINELTGLDINIKNHRIISSIVKVITKTTMKLFQSRIRRFIEIRLKDLINKEVENINVSEFIVQSLV